MGPTSEDFTAAAEWQITFPTDIDLTRHTLLQIRYQGDVAHVYAGERLITDNFYNNTPFDLGLDRCTPSELAEGLTLKILPLRKDAPIYSLHEDRPDFGGDASVARLLAVEIMERHEYAI